MTITAKLFMSGRSQAVRLPAKLRLQAKEVRIEQVGNALWVQPEPSPDQSIIDWLRSFYEATQPLPDTFSPSGMTARRKRATSIDIRYAPNAGHQYLQLRTAVSPRFHDRAVC